MHHCVPDFVHLWSKGLGYKIELSMGGVSMLRLTVGHPIMIYYKA